MKRISRTITRKIRLVTIILFSCALIALCGCDTYSGNSIAFIDWVDFIKIDDITYSGIIDRTSPIPQEELSFYAKIQYKVADVVTDPEYKLKNGDAAYLETGTPVYSIRGYSPAFRLAAWSGEKQILFEADTSPQAKYGADLLDIDGKVTYIGVNSQVDGKTELASIREEKQVSYLVRMVMEAPVDQTLHRSGQEQYFLVFYLRDSVAVKRSYWLDTGELSRGILLPGEFGDTIKSAIAARKPSPAPSAVAFFPVQKMGYESLAYPAALATGKLVLENGYLRLQTEGTDSGVLKTNLIIWPPGSVLQEQDNSLQVTREDRTIARLGEILNIGGGQVPSNIVTQYTGQTVPADCPGPFWLAAPGLYNSPRPSVTRAGPFPDPAKTLTEEMKNNPELITANIYADRYAVPVDEALKRLQMQPLFAQVGLSAKLESNESETFAGLWWQHEPEFKIVLAFTRDGEVTIKKYLDEKMTPFLPYLEVRTVQFTLSELKAVQL